MIGWLALRDVLIWVQHIVSFLGILIILSGIIVAILQYLYYLITGQLTHQGAKINMIRLSLGRILILGLEFIVAADLISTTTTPDYYSIGIVAIVVMIRTLLSFSINRELMSLKKE